MHILFLVFKVKKKGCILCRFGFVLWRKCASRYTNSPFIYSDIYSHTHAFCKHWLSTMSHTLSTTLRNSRSNHHPQGTYNPVKLLLPNESVEMRTQISMLLWEKRCVNMSHYCLSSPRDISKNSISISIRKRGKATAERTG